MSDHGMLANGFSRLLAESGRTFWLPPRGSEWAGTVDWLFHYILYISAFFFLLIVTLMVIFVIRYRQRPGHAPQPSPSHHTRLELLWTGIPLVLVGTMFYFGFTGFMDLAVVPLNAYEIQVTGQKWSWSFTYPNGHVDQDLHVPVDRMVQLTLTSSDVIHSLFIPVLRMKKDAVPGRYTKVWFRAEITGESPLMCAEYCGKGHSDMLAMFVIHPPGEFEKWLQDASNLLARMSPIEAGQRLYQLRGCRQCHSLDGTAGVGPTFKNLFGHSQPLASGEQIVADENYIRRSILEPNAQVVAGFDPVMPVARLKDEEVNALVTYIKSLSDRAPATQPGEATAGGAATQPAPAPSIAPAP